jgi:hypothetical protein
MPYDRYACHFISLLHLCHLLRMRSCKVMLAGNTAVCKKKIFELLVVYKHLSPSAAVKLLPCDHEVMSQVLVTTSWRNAGEGCVHKIQSGQSLPWTRCKQELLVPGCPFI